MEWDKIVPMLTPVVVGIIGFFLKSWLNRVEGRMTEMADSITLLLNWRGRHVSKNAERFRDIRRQLKVLRVEIRAIRKNQSHTDGGGVG